MKAALSLLLLAAEFVCSAQAIHRADTLVIGGIRQYITLDGRDRSLPLLLFLHGGPGGSVIAYAHKFTDRLREHFVVVQWDQRETGKTREMNASPVPLSVSLFRQDTRELIDSLLARFHRDKLYLAAHSWGTVLGFDIARTCPQKLYAYVAIGPMIRQLQSERIALEMLKDHARKSNNQTELEELSQVTIPFQSGEALYYHRKWLLAYSGSKRTLPSEYVKAWAATWLAVFNEASREDLMESLPVLECPVYFFAGTEDYQTNSRITEAYYKQLVAPKKALYWIHCGHSIPTSRPREMQQLLIERVLPETFPPGERPSVARQQSPR